VISGQPLFSLVMPAYNCEKYIRQAIESILQQTYPNWELLIADDGSSDSTKRIIDSCDDPRIKKHHNPQNQGYLKTCNKLFQMCQGDLLAFQDADDYSDPGRLQHYLDYFRQNPESGFCGTDYYLVNAEGKILNHTSFPGEHSLFVNSFPDQFPLIGAALCVKKEVYQTVGGYNEYFDRIGSEDFYWFGLMLEKFRFGNIPVPLYYYRFNPESLSKTNKDIRAKFSHDIVRFLIRQRRKYGTDSLNDPARRIELERFIKSNAIKHYFWNRRYKEAIALSLQHPVLFSTVVFHYLSPARRSRQLRKV